MSRRKRRPRPQFSKSIYILPNLFTTASLFCGFYSIISSINGDFLAAAVAIVIAGVFDGLDGAVARATHTTSKFGVEYDSLADLVSFGVAPGVLAYLWALNPFGRLGWVAGFLYVACGALRLARFNVYVPVKDQSYFQGLPIPAAASMIATTVFLFNHFGHTGSHQTRGPSGAHLRPLLSHGQQFQIHEFEKHRTPEEQTLQHPGGRRSDPGPGRGAAAGGSFYFLSGLRCFRSTANRLPDPEKASRGGRGRRS